jgi:hypothetical protein
LGADVSCSCYMWQHVCPQAIRKGSRLFTCSFLTLVDEIVYSHDVYKLQPENVNGHVLA